MKTIERIVIKGRPSVLGVMNGFTEDYAEKITLTNHSISYEYRPKKETEENPLRKWSYKGASRNFEKAFVRAASSIPRILSIPDVDRTLIADYDVQEFNITYTDKTKVRATYSLGPCAYAECFSAIESMIPTCEEDPLLFGGAFEVDCKKEKERK